MRVDRWQSGVSGSVGTAHTAHATGLAAAACGDSNVKAPQRWMQDCLLCLHVKS